MSKYFGFVIILLLMIMAGYAQPTLNYPAVDKTSWELFQQGKWTELIEYSDYARSQGIDFFYLQARTGIAYYNLGKYRKASGWFLKAWEKDQSFEWLQEYLYYSLVFGGRNSEATKIAGGFSSGVKEKIGFSDRQITRIALEAGYSFNPDFNSFTGSRHGQQANVGEDYGEAFYLKNYHFDALDISHRLAPGFSLNHNFTYIGLNREERVDWGTSYTFPIKINQFQYYLNPHFVLGSKLYVSPSATLIWGNSDLYLGGFSNNQTKIFYGAPFNYSDLIVSTAIWSHFGNLSPGLEVNRADISNNKFSQYSAWIAFYPFSNLNFYFTPRVYFKGIDENSFDYNVFGISAGVQLGPVHFYGQYLNGEMENFIESAGYIVSNFPGTSEQKFSGSFYIPAGKKSQIVLRYITQDVTETYQVYSNMVKINSVNYNYMKHTLTAGISWNF
jgi:hypothetical protein